MNRGLFRTNVDYLIAFLMISLPLFIYVNSYSHHIIFQNIPLYDSRILNRSLLAFAMIVSSYIVLSQNKLRLDKNSLLMIAVFVLFIAYYSISILWSPGQSYASYKTIRILGVLPFVFIIPIIIYGIRTHHFYLFYNVLLMLSILLTIDIFYSVVVLEQPVTQRVNTTYIGISRPMGLGVLFSMFLYFRRENPIYILLAMSMVFAMFQTGARGPLIAVLLSIAAFSFWIMPDIKYVGRRKIFQLASGLVVVGALIHSFGGQTISRLSVLLDGGGSSLGSRIDMYQSSLEYIVQSPIFGHGIGAFPILYNSYDARAYPHNIILEIFVEAGVIGVTMLLALLIIPYSITVRRKNSQPIVSGLAMASITYVVINAMVSGDIYSNAPVFFFATIPLAILKRNQSKC